MLMGILSSSWSIAIFIPTIFFVSIFSIVKGCHSGIEDNLSKNKKTTHIVIKCTATLLRHIVPFLIFPYGRVRLFFNQYSAERAAVGLTCFGRKRSTRVFNWWEGPGQPWSVLSGSTETLVVCVSLSSIQIKRKLKCMDDLIQFKVSFNLIWWGQHAFWFRSNLITILDVKLISVFFFEVFNLTYLLIPTESSVLFSQMKAVKWVDCCVPLFKACSVSGSLE